MPANKLKVVKKIELYRGSALLGEAVCMEDGYYSFFPATNNEGGWPPYMLRWIADELDKLHQDWDKQVQEYFGAEPKINLDALYGPARNDGLVQRMPAPMLDLSSLAPEIPEEAVGVGQRPPLGLEPEFLVETAQQAYDRPREILAAMDRYLAAQKGIPKTWVEELSRRLGYPRPVEV